MDPVADKLLVCTALVLLSGRYGPAFSIPTAVIVCREVAVSALREFMSTLGRRDAVKVGFLGKLKTALTMVAVTTALAADDTKWGSRAFQTGKYGLWGCAAVTLASAVPYFRVFFKVCKEE